MRTKSLDFFEVMDVACGLQKRGIEPSYRAVGKAMGVAATTVMRNFPRDLLNLIKEGHVRSSFDKSSEARREWLRALAIATQLSDLNEKISPRAISDAIGASHDDDLHNIPAWDLLEMVEKGFLRVGPRAPG
jgi:hypothetical protein